MEEEELKKEIINALRELKLALSVAKREKEKR